MDLSDPRGTRYAFEPHNTPTRAIQFYVTVNPSESNMKNLVAKDNFTEGILYPCIGIEHIGGEHKFMVPDNSGMFHWITHMAFRYAEPIQVCRPTKEVTTDILTASEEKPRTRGRGMQKVEQVENNRSF